ncbi:type IV pilin protein [Shewanella woodyi]|uniref:Type IV pilus biogenesis protein PilE n=1 Tax=Shewanella woodyi (strain ATCC 51908 / MS32) TaxID=392500 RepID=B1KIU3_SHEWM|nr:type IV pilin protein [Shewanella woodyi]ACA85591.1 Type IV pilus biogenesis protein PilE [Shewanella woodyi ATCC 51908]
MKMRNGFTLVELMVGIAIIGILTAIAYPSYTEYVAEGARAEAHTSLLRISNLQEQFYLDNRTYTEDMNELGVGADPFVTQSNLYSVDSTGTGSFVLVATALGVQATRDSACATIQITDTGAKTPTECW